MTKNNLSLSLLIGASLFFSHPSWAQLGKGAAPSSPQREKVTQANAQTTKVLDKAKNEANANASQLDQDKTKSDGKLDNIIDKAKQTAANLDKSSSPETSSALKQAITELVPEGKTLLSKSTDAPAMRAPTGENVVNPNTLKHTAATGDNAPQPEPLAPTPLSATTKKEKEPERTVITSQGEAFFDSKQAMGVFTDDVVVSHPQFHMTCDVLEIYMNKTEPKNDNSAATKPDAATKVEPSPVGANGAAPVGDSNIKQAIAKGKKVVIQKLSETGEMQIGICRHATYIGDTGDIVMRDYPQVQRGNNIVIATSPVTVMTIKPNGQFFTKGPSDTKIIQQTDKKASQPSVQAQSPKPQELNL